MALWQCNLIGRVNDVSNFKMSDPRGQGNFDFALVCRKACEKELPRPASSMHPAVAQPVARVSLTVCKIQDTPMIDKESQMDDDGPAPAGPPRGAPPLATANNQQAPSLVKQHPTCAAAARTSTAARLHCRPQELGCQPFQNC